MSWIVLALTADAWPATNLVVRADRSTDADGTTTLWDGERAVHRVPSALVVAVTPHPTRKAAEAELARLREAGVGGATVHVAERGVVRHGRGRGGSGQGTAIPAEGVRVVVERE